MQPGQATCGAKTRKGSPCKDIAMENGRCKRHGGKTPKSAAFPIGAKNPNSNSGIYSQFLSDDDKKLYADAADQIGAVDHEIQLTRLRLARTVKARAAWEASLVDPVRSDGDGHLVHIETVDDQSLSKDGDVYDLTKKVHRLPPFDEIEHRCLARIESLEKTRKELMKAPEDPDALDDGSSRDRVTFTGGLDGGTDEELPSPFASDKRSK